MAAIAIVPPVGCRLAFHLIILWKTLIILCRWQLMLIWNYTPIQDGSISGFEEIGHKCTIKEQILPMQALKVFRWLCRLTRVSTDCHDQHTKYKPSKLVHSETQRSLHSRTKLISSGFDNLTLQLRSAYSRHQWNQGRSTVKVGHCIDVICVCSESPSLFCYAQVSTL